MKRRLCLAAVFLLLGATVNVAVAWGCAVWSVAPAIGPPRVLRVREWLEHLLAGDIADRERASEIVWAGFGYKRTQSARASASSLDAEWSITVTPTSSHARVRQGWPVLSLQANYDVTIVQVKPGLRAGIAIPPWIPWAQPARRLAVRPLWPGFPVNTLLYATVLWLLIPGPFALRRFFRVRRGLCPACAYPHGESAMCSECGGALPKREKVAT